MEPGEIQLDDHALAALVGDGLGEAFGVGPRPRGHDDEEAFLGELLGDRAADAPARAHRHVGVAHGRAAADEPGVASVRLPLRGRADHHGHLAAVRIGPADAHRRLP